MTDFVVVVLLEGTQEFTATVQTLNYSISEARNCVIFLRGAFDNTVMVCWETMLDMRALVPANVVRSGTVLPSIWK